MLAAHRNATSQQNDEHCSTELAGVSDQLNHGESKATQVSDAVVVWHWPVSVALCGSSLVFHLRAKVAVCGAGCRPALSSLARQSDKAALAQEQPLKRGSPSKGSTCFMFGSIWPVSVDSSA